MFWILVFPKGGSGGTNTRTGRMSGIICTIYLFIYVHYDIILLSSYLICSNVLLKCKCEPKSWKNLREQFTNQKCWCLGEPLKSSRHQFPFSSTIKSFEMIFCYFQQQETLELWREEKKKNSVHFCRVLSLNPELVTLKSLFLLTPLVFFL